MALTQISTQSIKDGTITGSDLATNVDLVDNQKLRFGTGNDLQIYFDGTNSFIKEPNSVAGQLVIDGYNGTDIRRGATGDHIIRAIGGGAVELYNNGSKKFETWTSGARIPLDNGVLAIGAGDDLRFWHNATNSIIRNATGELQIQSNSLRLANYNATETYISATENGAVNIFYDDSKKFETTSGGALVTGNFFLNDNGELTLGTGGDFKIFHTGTASKINNSTGSLFIQSDVTSFHGDGGSETMASFTKNGAVELLYDNALKFETTSSGVQIAGKINFTGTGQAIDLIDNQQIRLGTGDDLQIYHDGSNSYLEDAGTGKLILLSSQVQINNPASNETMANFIQNGAVELYHDDSKKFETTSGGVLATGDVESSTGIFEHTTNFTTQLKFNSSNETQLKHLSNGQVKLSFVGLSNAARGSIDAQSGFIQIKTAADETGIICRDNSSTDLYFDGTKKFETTSTGATVTGFLGINVASPDSPLEVEGTGPSLATIHHSDGGTNDEARIILGALASNPPDQRGAGIAALNNGAGHDLLIKCSASHSAGPGEKVRVRSDGNVGINQTNPSKAKLHVVGDNTDNDIIAKFKSGGGGASSKSYIALVSGYSDTANDIEGHAYIGVERSGSGNKANIIFSPYDGGSAVTERLRIRHGGGICFNGDTAAANALDDYEEGSLNWELAKSSTPSLGSNNGSNVKYVKVGQLVHISGRIRTDSCGSAGGDNFVFQSGSTLPFTPETSGTSVVGHWRSQDQTDSSLTASIAWVGSSTTLYLYTIDAKNDYAADTNNVPADSQTNLVITFSLTYRANS